MNVLRSVFDPGAQTIALELTLDSPVDIGSRLALTSIVQLTPTERSGARLVDRLASYHEFEPSRPGGLRTWVIDDLGLSHAPLHANDGPVSVFVVAPDGSTLEVEVEPMQRVGDVTSPPDPPPRVLTTDQPALVPWPVSIEIDDPAPSGHRAARLSSGPDVARRAWDAVSALEARLGGTHLCQDDVGVTSAQVVAELDPRLLGEQYGLAVDGVAVTVVASQASGFRHAFVTLAQWLASGLPTHAAVDDHPCYPFRGLHIDLARQWFEPDVVGRLIDIAAWRKLSHVHLHLSDDEAWRLPVEGLPELGTAGVRGHGLPIPPMLGGGPRPTGRTYAASEIADWVARADELGIILVPEIDMPAHLHAALTVMPSLRDPDDTSGAASVQFFADNVLVPGQPCTAPFVDRVVDAIASLFPSSPWIHIGGDEVPEGAWSGSPIAAEYMRTHGLSTVHELEAAFHRGLVATIRVRAGRGVAAWEEAAGSGGVRPGDGYVVAWRTAEAGRSLAAQGYDVVMSPGQAYYLDMATDDEWSTPGSSWAGATSLTDVCTFDPAEGWTVAERAHLLGVQACVWTEHVHDEPTLHQFLFPRLDAIAERGWTGTITGGVRSLSHRASSGH